MPGNCAAGSSRLIALLLGVSTRVISICDIDARLGTRPDAWSRMTRSSRLDQIFRI